MSVAASLLRSLLRRLVRLLVLLLRRRVAGREAWLLAELERLPEGHRRRRGLERELEKLWRHLDALDEAAESDDPRWAGALAEVARVRNDAGRRAVARRLVYPRWFFALPEARPAPVATREPPEERCTPCIAVT